MFRRLLFLLYLLPLLFLAIFYAFPLLAILRESFFAPGGDALAQIQSTLQSWAFWGLVWFTTWQAAVSTLLTVLLGLPIAYLFATYDFAGKRLLHSLLAIPFVMPTVVVATAFVALVGRNGVINHWLQSLFALPAPPLQVEQTIWLILVVHVFFNVSVIIRAVGGFWSNLNPHLRESAAVLGAPPWRVFLTVTLPLLLPSLLAASLLVFLFTFTSFGVILILGGPHFATIEVEIYRQTVSYFNLPLAAFLALVQLAITFTVMAVYTRLQARASRPLTQKSQQRTARRPANWRQRLLLGGAIGLTILFLLGPLAALAWRSVALTGAVTFDFYAALGQNPRQSAFFAPPVDAIRNSLLIAGSTLLLSLPLGIIAAYMLARPASRWAALLDPLLLLPLGTSAVTLGFGYIVAMGPLRTSLLLVPVAHTLIALPFVVRSLLPALRALDTRLRDAAAALGASPPLVWRYVDVPMLWRPLLVAAVYAFTISLGEFGATLLLTRPDFPTMPTVIYRALGKPGVLNYGQALAMSTILMAVTAVSISVLERFRLGDNEEF